MFRYIPANELCENLEGYRPGGYHPVTLGDTFADARYKVLHKLGSGSYGTVWLARDQTRHRYVALKLLTADKSQERNELRVYQHLQARGTKHGTNTHVAQLLDHFEVEGPYGNHLCLILPLLGPSLASFQSSRGMKIKPDVAQLLASQMIQAVDQLHKNGIVPGDISADNILFDLRNIDNFSVEELYADFGWPISRKVLPFQFFEPASLKPIYLAETDPKAPEYWYEALDFGQADPILIAPSIVLVDFGEAVILGKLDTSVNRGYSLSYAAPEALYYDEPSKAINIWALACCWFEVRTAKQLFSDDFFGHGARSVLRSVVNAIGPMPESLRQRLEERGVVPLPELPTADLEPALRTSIETSFERKSLEDRVRSIGEWMPWHYWTPERRRETLIATEMTMNDSVPTERLAAIEARVREEPPPGQLSQKEVGDFTDLLARCLRYDPAERMSMAEVHEHPWFKTKYENDWRPVDWLTKYDWGFVTGP